MKFKELVVAIVVLVLIIVGVFVGSHYSAVNDIKNFTYEEIEMSLVKDGSYTGSAEAFLGSVELLVSVENHEIVEIELLEHRHSMGYNAEAIKYKMIENNTYEVDAISGATLSSEAIKSAVSIALKQGY